MDKITFRYRLGEIRGTKGKGEGSLVSVLVQIQSVLFLRNSGRFPPLIIVEQVPESRSDDSMCWR